MYPGELIKTVGYLLQKVLIKTNLKRCSRVLKILTQRIPEAQV
jgi:hypothetical protein